jgi:hypothetical protein
VALVTAPAFRLRGIEWALDRPAQVNADWSGKRTIDTAPLYGKWRARVELATEESEAAFRTLRSFLVRLCGHTHTFRLPATLDAQNANSGVTVASTAAAGAITMSLSGASAPLLAGQLVTVGNQLLQLVEDQAGAVIAFEPPLRAQASGGAAVETANPYALVHLSDGTVEWAVEPPQRFSASFAAEEAY